jgi:hypothetical protein
MNHARPLRIGVVGHRRYDDAARATAGIDAVLARLADASAPTVITSLAEGADRLVAERILLREGARMEVVLPLAPDDFCRDFATDTSKADFERLLARADQVDVVDAAADASRDDCYELAARAVLGRSDVVLAVWDGLPGRGQGGTADSVAHAREQGIPVEIVSVTRPMSRGAT